MENNKPINGDVVHIANHELSHNFKYEDPEIRNRKDSRLQIVSVDEAAELFKQSGIEWDNFYEGQILFKHPFAPNTYVEANYNPVELFRDKYTKMVSVLRFLGVKSVTVEKVWTEQFKREVEVNGNIGIKKFGANFDYDHKETSNTNNRYQMQYEFEGSSVTADMYSKAIEYAKQCGLYNDIDVRGFLENRNPAYPNLQKHMSLEIDLSKEYNELTNIAFSLNVLKIFEIGFKYKETLEIVNKENMKLDVLF